MDAAVNGGIHNYKKAFLHEDFLKEHPDFEELIDGNLDLRSILIIVYKS